MFVDQWAWFSGPGAGTRGGYPGSEGEQLSFQRILGESDFRITGTVMRISPSNILILFLLAGAASAQGAMEEKLDAAGVEFFEKRIRPILVEH